MNKNFSFYHAFALGLFFMYVSKNPVSIPFWYIFIPFVLSALETILKAAFRFSGLEIRFYDAMTRMLIRLKAWQIIRSLKKRK